MSTTTNLNTLKINYLTEAQYAAAVNGGTINENELYFTPSSIAEGEVVDVQINGVSIVTNGIAVLPIYNGGVQ